MLYRYIAEDSPIAIAIPRIIEDPLSCEMLCVTDDNVNIRNIVYILYIRLKAITAKLFNMDEYNCETM